MVYIAYDTEMILKASKNYAFVAKIENSKFAHDKNFCSHFCPRRKAANFCHPVQTPTQALEKITASQSCVLR